MRLWKSFGFVAGWGMGVVFATVLIHLAQPVIAATLSRGQTYASNEQITNTKLHNLIDLATISGIVQADIATNAGLALRQTTAPTDTDAVWVDTTTTPPVLKVHDGTAWQAQNVPKNGIILADAACPSGYTRVAALDGKFLVGAATYSAAAGGSDTHTHGVGSYAGPSHTHNVLATSTGWGNTTTNSPSAMRTSRDSGDLGVATTDLASGSGGTGAITGTSASTDGRPAFANIIICKKD